MKKTLLAAFTVVLLLLAACIAEGGPVESTTTTEAAETTTTTEAAETTTTTEAVETTTTTIHTTSDNFQVVGNEIFTPSGEKFIPVGANIAVRTRFETGYVFNWLGTGTGKSDSVQAWGWNTVRATMICAPPANPGLQATHDGLDTFIEEYTAKGIVVIVECHDGTGKDWTPTHPEAIQVLEFIDALVERHGDNPYVWYNTFNEPYQADNIAGWSALQQEAYNRVRSGSDSIFIADVPNYGQGIHHLQNGNIKFLADNGVNVVYGWHTWGAITDPDTPENLMYQSRFNETWSMNAHRKAFEWINNNNYAVVVGEFGDPLTLNEGTAGPPIWNRHGANATLEYALDNGVGMLWWHATGDSGIFLTYSLMANRQSAPWNALPNGTGLSAAGQKFWDATH